MTRHILLVLLVTPAALPYIVTRSSSGAVATRSDYTNVQMFLNQNFIPGFTNSDGAIAITPDSDVVGALNAAMATWNNVPTTAAHFAPVQPTAAANGSNIILMSDTPAVRSMLGPSLSALTTLFVSGTTIINTQIFLNPVLTYSTTGAPNTYDLQSVFTKQLGNALGLSNSAVIGSSLFIFSSAQSVTKQNLSPDDVAGVSGLYPASGSSAYGTLGGTLTLNGSPLRNALVSAVDTGTGAALATLTKLTDGTWSMATPPGNYLVYAQPLQTDPNQFGQVIAPYYVGAIDPIDTNFQPTFLGSGTVRQAASASAASNPFVEPCPLSCGHSFTTERPAPNRAATCRSTVRERFAGGSESSRRADQQNLSYTLVSVTAASSSDASFSPDPVSGSAQTSLLSVYAVPVGAAPPLELSITPGPVTVISGRSYDLVLQGVGIDSTLTESGIQVFGPLSLRPGSTKVDKTPPLNFNGVDYPNVRFTVDIPPASAQTYGTLIISNNGSFASYTGGIVIVPPQ